MVADSAVGSHVGAALLSDLVNGDWCLLSSETLLVDEAIVARDCPGEVV